MNGIEEKTPILLTVKQFSEKHPAFPQGALRAYIFNAASNGFSRVIRRVGRRV